MESDAPPSAGWYNFLGWLDVNRKRVAMIAGIVVIVGGVIAILVWRHSERETEAAEALSSVRMPFNPMDPVPPGTAEEFVKVAENYSKTPAAAQARLRAATLYFSAGQYDKAQDQLKKFLAEYGDTQWVPQAQFSMATCLEAQGKTADAIAKYNDFIRAYPNDPAADEARFNLVRLYENSNQPTQAIDLLTKMTNGLPQFSPLIGEVQERLKAIYMKNPALMPAPAPRIAPQTMTMTNTQRFTPGPVVVPIPDSAPGVTPTPAPATPTPAPSATPATPGNAPKISIQPPKATPPAGAPPTTTPGK